MKEFNNQWHAIFWNKTESSCRLNGFGPFINIPGHISSRFASNSQAFAWELEENLEDICSSFKEKCHAVNSLIDQIKHIIHEMDNLLFISENILFITVTPRQPQSCNCLF